MNLRFYKIDEIYGFQNDSNHYNVPKNVHCFLQLLILLRGAFLSKYLPRLLFSCASLHLPTTLIMALPAIRVQCMTAGKFGSLLAWFVMSAPNCGGLMLDSLCYELAGKYISVLLCFSRDISHSGRNTTPDTFVKTFGFCHAALFIYRHQLF